MKPTPVEAPLARMTLLVLTTLGLCTAVQAGLPLQTEDAGLLGRGHCEAELANLSVRDDGSSARETGLALDCGVTKGSQIGLGWATVHAGSEGGDIVSLGGKTGLWQHDEAALALTWRLGWERESGQGWQHTGYELNLVHSAPLAGGLTLHANLLHASDRLADERSTGWALALEHEGGGLGGVQVAPMAEVFGDDRGAPWWNAAVRFTLVPDLWFVGLSYGRQVDSGRARLATASVKLAF